MNKRWQQIWTAVLLGVLLPGLVLRTAVLLRRPVPWAPERKPEEPQQVQQIPVLFGDTVVTMALEEYLVGVVLQEMPAAFEFEAKKAQAVVARTYALRTCEISGKHPEGAVCTDHTCCQAYIDPKAYVDGGGTEEAVESARQAAEATQGQVLTYDGKLIDATYFSCSGGQTEDAAAVWGADVPYLQSVSSPGEEGAEHYTDTVSFTAAGFAAALGAELTGRPETWLGQTIRTEGGGIDTVQIGGITYEGVDLRERLGLRSTAIYMTAVGDTVTVTTKGYGHRVGMSQYGADAMALSGSGYAEILAHYYAGTTLEDHAEDRTNR